VVQVRVNGLRFRGLHGVFESERAQGNDFLAAIVIEVEGDADQTDDLAGTVDYGEVVDLALAVNDSKSFRTVEALAGSIGRAVLQRFPLAAAVEVTVDKLKPAGVSGVESCGARVRLVR
jgi:dihydroneopterin aldolase